MIIRLDDNTWYIKTGVLHRTDIVFERFENNKDVIRSRISRKDKQYNGQTKKDTRVYGKGKQFIPLMLCELWCAGMVSSSYL